MSNNSHKRKRSDDNDHNVSSGGSQAKASVVNEYVDDYSPKRVRHRYVQGLYVCDDALDLFSDDEIVRYARVAHKWFARQRAADLSRRASSPVSPLSPSSSSSSSSSAADRIVDGDQSPDRSPSHDSDNSDSNSSDKENNRGLSSRLHDTRLTPSALSASPSSNKKKRARGDSGSDRRGSKFRR